MDADGMCSAEELLGLTTDPANLTDSPDLGPPPIAHFEEGDPIKFDPSQDLSSRSEPAAEDENPVLSANLETRKKRRESSHRQDLGADKAMRESRKSVSSIDAETGQPLKSGAKRKFDVREEDNSSEAMDILETEAFQNNRRNSDIRRLDTATSKPTINRVSRSESKTSQTVLSSRQHQREKSVDLPTASVTNTRKALGPSKYSWDIPSIPI